MSTEFNADDAQEPTVFDQLADVPTTVIGSTRAMSGSTVFLRVNVAADASELKLTFNPVNVEEARATRELNRSIRLGFIPPRSSTR